MMKIKNIKLRKEEFGWIACDLTNCNVYEVSEIMAHFLQLIYQQDDLSRNQIITNFVKEFNFTEEKARLEVDKVFECLEDIGWIDEL